jgi:hypothetical protein
MLASDRGALHHFMLGRYPAGFGMDARLGAVAERFGGEVARFSDGR